MSDFTQIDPDEGQPATERTEVRVLYDDRALYVGVRLFDRDAAQIGRRLARATGMPMPIASRSISTPCTTT
jgi:hypothetical protein